MNIRLKLLPHQRKLMRSHAKKSLLLCGRGAGKSFICAVLILLTLLQGKNVLVGGSRYDTIHDTLLAEIKELAFKWCVFDRIEWHEKPMRMDFGNAHVWFGTYEAPQSSRGYSKVSLLILDELYLAPPNIISIWGPCMRATGGDTRIVGATTPQPGSLWNVLFSSPDCDWEIIRAVSTDNIYMSKDEYDLIVSEIHDDATYRSEILGEITEGLGNSAIIRLGDFPKFPAPSTDTRVLAGLDVAEGVERDATAFFKRRGNKVLEMWKLNGISHEETVHRILKSHKETKIDFLALDAAFSDYEFNILKYDIASEQVNFARAASEQNREKYANVRAEMFFNLAWHIKEGLSVEGFELSPELKRQLCAIGWKHNSQGRLLLTPKEELRAVLRMSTDIADAAALTCLQRYTGDEPNMRSNTLMSQSELDKILEDE